MLRAFLVSAAFLGTALSQTHFCDDGWELYTSTWNGVEHHSCFHFGLDSEKVSHDHAKILCEAHGGFLAEVPWGPQLNHWIVLQLLDRAKETGERRPHFERQYWLGARDFGHHNEHIPGTWVWEHRNTTVEWFDWGTNEPNNYGGQNCLTYLYYEDIFGFRNFHWNDWSCDEAADFICEKIID